MAKVEYPFMVFIHFIYIALVTKGLVKQYAHTGKPLLFSIDVKKDIYIHTYIHICLHGCMLNEWTNEEWTELQSVLWYC